MRSQYSENFLYADINLDGRDTDDADLKDSSNETVTSERRNEKRVKYQLSADIKHNSRDTNDAEPTKSSDKNVTPNEYKKPQTILHKRGYGDLLKFM